MLGLKCIQLPQCFPSHPIVPLSTITSNGLFAPHSNDNHSSTPPRASQDDKLDVRAVPFFEEVEKDSGDGATHRMTAVKLRLLVETVS